MPVGTKAPGAVLLNVLTQDPAVITAGPRPLTPVQPVVAHARRGFWEGPACERVAVVDLLPDGEVGPPVRLDPAGSRYRGVSQYQVATPRVHGASEAPWARQSGQTTLGRLGDSDDDEPFLPVSVFGTVIRAITFIEDPVVLGRGVEWAFGGRRILIVPRGRGQQNAFYHRPSGSLRFYSFPSEAGSAELVHTGLSQDIVTHETTHAVVDGIAPDLYDAIGPDGLAIHEAVADFTAAMISLRNRELTDPQRRTLPQQPWRPSAVRAATRGSRSSSAVPTPIAKRCATPTTAGRSARSPARRDGSWIRALRTR